MQEELNILIQAQYPLIYLITPEEERAERAVYDIVKSQQRRVFVWTVTHGIVEYGQPRQTTQHNTVSPEAAIEWVIRQREPGIYIFKDLHPFIEAPQITRWLRDAIACFKGTEKIIILMSPVQTIPIELEKEVVVLDYPLPDMKELNEVLSRQLEQSTRSTSRRTSTQTREKLLKAALGLTKDEAQKVYRKAYVKAKRLTEDEVDIVLSEKKQLIRRNGILEYLEGEETLDSVGGSEDLKNWLRQRSGSFTEKAREYGLPQPKGLLILGVPGCGKSLIAKATARLWGLPLIRLDMGRVYDGSMVGRSEANLRNALKTVESISPAILFIDELDKSFAGARGSADSDGGTSSRIFGSFLTWMQEKTSPVFVMATANLVKQLPGEFLRKGRFDEIFFVDLPTLEERRDIFKIHLAKRRQDIERFDLEQLARMSEVEKVVTIRDQKVPVLSSLSGAEIEQAIIAAMYEAFAQDREFTQLDIIAAIKATVPLSLTMTEQIDALRKWAKERARSASNSIAEEERREEEYRQMEF